MTSAASPHDEQRVVVVTGGGGGIGAAIAEELGRQGAFVVTMDPLVSLDGRERLPDADDTTAGRIVAAGGAARASEVSVTDRDAVRGLFDELGRLDAVVNVAGITRPTSFARGTEEDWRRVLEVHLDGYLNVLAAALPIMAAAGHGRILGVTSGSGWRPADAGAYSCAKRAVAALTWQLGHQAPPGVVVNAISPIAVTRMVTAALGRAAPSGGGGPRRSATGGLSLASMPDPEALGPFGAHLVSDELGWCSGQVLFAGGSEVAVIEPPRLLEVVRTDDVASLAPVLDVVVPGALAPAEAEQGSAGGSNPRFGSLFGEPGPADLASGAARTCAVVADDPALAAAVTAGLEARSVTCTAVPAGEVPTGFGGAADALAAAVQRVGPLDAVVVALGGGASASGSEPGWAQVLAEHDGIVERIHDDAGWARAVADHAAATDRPLRLVTLTDATTAGGRSRAQASAQLARASRGSTAERVAAFAVSLEAPLATGAEPIGALVAHLVGHPEAPAVSGAELVADAGWIGLRSHPRPGTSITFGGPAVPGWFDAILRRIVREMGPASDDAPTRPRVVDAHVHLWDPARTDWYPYLSGRQPLHMGDVSGMARRFDVPTYRSEVAGWNVEKLVNVAAATGAYSIDETLELEQRAEVDGHPDAIIGGLPPTTSVAEAVELLDRQMAASRFRGVRPMGVPLDQPLPAADVLAVLQERRLVFELMTRTDSLEAAAAGLAAFPDLVVVVEHAGWPRSGSDEEHALWTAGIDALARLGPNVHCKISGLAMPLGSMQVDALAPWVEHVIAAFGTGRCLFASNFPVDGLQGTFDELYSTYAALTAGLDDAARDQLFAANAERVYRC